MSDTAYLFILAGVWSLIALAIVWFVPKWPAKIVVFALLVGIPFWELPYGYYNFEKLCNREAKLQVYETIVPQDSICVENLDSGTYAGLTKVGFSRIEVKGGSDDRKRDIASGRVFPTKSQDIKSQYCLQFASNIALPWRIVRDDTLIARAGDRQVIGRQSRFLWFGMWWQDQARPILGRGGMCFDDPLRPIRFIRAGTS